MLRKVLHRPGQRQRQRHTDTQTHRHRHTDTQTQTVLDTCHVRHCDMLCPDAMSGTWVCYASMRIQHTTVQCLAYAMSGTGLSDSHATWYCVVQYCSWLWCYGTDLRYGATHSGELTW
eukprot:217898-Rhodomonas_salina.1